MEDGLDFLAIFKTIVSPGRIAKKDGFFPFNYNIADVLWLVKVALTFFPHASSVAGLLASAFRHFQKAEGLRGSVN